MEPTLYSEKSALCVYRRGRSFEVTIRPLVFEDDLEEYIKFMKQHDIERRDAPLLKVSAQGCGLHSADGAFVDGHLIGCVVSTLQLIGTRNYTSLEVQIAEETGKKASFLEMWFGIVDRYLDLSGSTHRYRRVLKDSYGTFVVYVPLEDSTTVAFLSSLGFGFFAKTERHGEEVFAYIKS
ncbi:hypothetical protein QR680_000701 [Steinernema hermaphroditum]|uniref:Uncharacterized protein n=1 Tax=Steinernema hermaphroditum TaxID=289476 RepID=A0AA39LEK0_9BILA|nr:hypothetical protein QR680_000701 [Steinernema hermaphroditum]